MRVLIKIFNISILISLVLSECPNVKECFHGGIFNNNNCECECFPSYFGEQCQNADCTQEPEMCGTVLMPDTCPVDLIEYYCPKMCNPPVCKCGFDKCLNDGIFNPDTCSCQCPLEFEGPTCDKPKTCLNGLTCQNSGNLNLASCECECFVNYKGAQCENLICDVPDPEDCMSYTLDYCVVEALSSYCPHLCSKCSGGEGKSNSSGVSLTTGSGSLTGDTTPESGSEASGASVPFGTTSVGLFTDAGTGQDVTGGQTNLNTGATNLITESENTDATGSVTNGVSDETETGVTDQTQSDSTGEISSSTFESQNTGQTDEVQTGISGATKPTGGNTDSAAEVSGGSPVTGGATEVSGGPPVTGGATEVSGGPPVTNSGVTGSEQEATGQTTGSDVSDATKPESSDSPDTSLPKASEVTGSATQAGVTNQEATDEISSASGSATKDTATDSVDTVTHRDNPTKVSDSSLTEIPSTGGTNPTMVSEAESTGDNSPSTSENSNEPITTKSETTGSSCKILECKNLANFNLETCKCDCLASNTGELCEKLVCKKDNEQACTDESLCANILFKTFCPNMCGECK